MLGLWRFMAIRMMGIPFHIPLSVLPDYRDFPSMCMLTSAIVGMAGLEIVQFMLTNVDEARLLKMYGGG